MPSGDSPFSPGKPVTPELFVGRQQEIRRFQSKLKKSANGSIESVFLTGERGIGKSSFAVVMGVYSATNSRLAPVYCQLTAAKSLDDALYLISQRIIQRFPQKSILERIKRTFDRYIDGIDFGLFPGLGARVSLKKDAESMRSLRLSFPDLIVSTVEDIKETAGGIFLILDDLNGITKDPDFGNFIKGVVDGLVTGGHERLPLTLTLVGISERLDDMINNQPSVGRIFDLIRLEKLENIEVSKFFSSAFNTVGLTVTANALDRMTFWSGGMPAIMHEVGDAAFWQNEDELIDLDDAEAGCVLAADNIGRKYLEPRVFEKLRSDSYRSILEQIAQFGQPIITRRALRDALDNTERKRLDNFFRKMVEAGVLTSTGAAGQYKFTRRIYDLYNYLRYFRRSTG